MVKDIALGASDSPYGSLTNINGTLYFHANDGTHGSELLEVGWDRRRDGAGQGHQPGRAAP